MPAQEIISTEPATGAVLWRQRSGDADAEVAHARRSWAEWAARPHTYRIEALRRFANVVRQKSEAFTDLLARETGKPIWEARSEIESVIGKVEISIAAYSQRTGQQRIDAPMNTRLALRHKPHGVLAVLGPYNFPVHLPNGHIVPALLAGNAVVFKPSEKTPASGRVPDRLLPCRGRARRLRAAADRRARGGQARRASRYRRAAVHRLGQHRHRAQPHVRDAAPRRSSRSRWAATTRSWCGSTPDLYSAAVLVVQSAFTTAGQRCTAARRLIVDQKLYEPLMAEIIKLTGRLIIGEPHADPAPFMGPVIDNDTADMLTESFLALSTRGGRPLRHMERPDRRPPVPGPPG